MRLIAAAALLLLPAIAASQECRPPKTSNEAEAFGIVSVPLAFGRAQAPELLAGLRIGLEAAYMPQVDDATATPTICRPGKGPENVNLSPVLPRPRLSVPLPLGLALEASWVPPVRVGGVKANLFGVSLARSFGNIDGIESDGKGGYLVSDYLAGKVLHVSSDGQSSLVRQFMPGAADIGFVADKGVLLVPHMNENQIGAYDISASLN